MTQIYERFDAATRNITAQALLFDGKPVGRIVIKHGAAATAYVQMWGASMASARATGYGYDKASAAVMSALGRIPAEQMDSETARLVSLVYEVARQWDGGTRYANALEQAGFTVCNVI